MASNKLKTVLSILCCTSFFINSNSQTITKYWVTFIDKANSSYVISNPSAFLSVKAITRRTNQSIAIDVTDIPVNQTYVNQVNTTGALVFQTSKWFNAAIVVITNTTQLTAINSLTCVLGSSPVAKVYKTVVDETTPVSINSFKTNTLATTTYQYGSSLTQVSQIGVDCMHNAGYRGNNITIGVIDSGFRNAGTNPVFDSLRNEGRLLGTRDIVDGGTSVYEDDSHGAMVLSCISGNSPGNLIGTAPKAGVYLLRSEDVASEKIIEENNWIVAAELADSLGVDIITTSLGYTTFDISSQNHTYAHLNGRTSFASIASTMAARKGIFVLNAAGNEGSGAWGYIGIPADADSICTVGSVNGSGIHSGFSSRGPTADGRIKPEVSTMGEGTYVCGVNGNFLSGNGTSFACPIMAGAVACLWEANPTKTNMQLLQAIKLTASQGATPNNNYGYGIPNICAAHNYLNGTSLGLNNEKELSLLSLYPKPSNGIINFSFSQNIQSITITDVLGKIIPFITSQIQNRNYTLTYNPYLSEGVYFLNIKTESGALTKKFIHQQ